MENKPALTSEQRLAYIGDMADLETREMTLKKAIETLQNENSSLVYRAEREVKEKENMASKCRRAQDEALQEFRNCFDYDPPKAPTEPPKPDCWEEYQQAKKITLPDKEDRVAYFWARLFFLWLPVALTVAGYIAPLLIEEYLSDIYDMSDFEMVLVGVVFVGILYALVETMLAIRFKIKFRVRTKKQNKYYEKYHEAIEYENLLAKYNEEYKKYCNDMNQYRYLLDASAKASNDCQESEELLKYAQDKKELALLQAKANNAQIAILQKSLQTLQSQKQELYSIGIIPPDYREMDCVIMLHQIFRNGLKDNMADAILLYEERIFRQEIIRGIDKIYNMLGRLNDSMRAIESRLLEVKQELQMIGSDMSTQLAAIADNQSRLLSEMEDASEAQAAYAAAQEQWQREQLAETRASRYAAEAVQRSNEKYEWYMEQHRRGFM